MSRSRQTYCSHDSGCDYYRRGICYNDDNACKYQRQHPDEPSDAEKAEAVLTNADRIRAMSDEELAVFFAKICAALYRADLPVIAYHGETVNENLNWLCQPAKEDNDVRTAETPQTE